MDRLQTMEVFVAVAEEAGFASAARRLNMSPPSVTRAISELEARIGARLFHRTTRRVGLSDAGRRYLEDCRRILSEVEAADRQAAGIHTAPSGPVTVTAPVMFGTRVLSPLLLDLLDRYPKIMVTATFVDRVADMYEDGIDVAVRIAELPDSSLTAVRVGEVRRVMCASPSYIAAHGSPSTPAELAAHPLIDHVNMTPGGEWRFGDARDRVAFRPRARFRVNTAEAAVAAATAGRGITRVLSYQVAAGISAGELETVLDAYAPPPVPVYVVHREAGQTSGRVRAVVDDLVAGLRANPMLA